uniref:Uncharacterized protein n=1 Tax=Anguilla anguilla TaxID=7936 RepID=A0A0E9UM56_ANGAN
MDVLSAFRQVSADSTCPVRVYAISACTFGG